MKLIDNKKQLMKLWSVQAAVMSAVFAILDFVSQLTDVLPFVKDYVPDNTFRLMSLVCAVSVPILRAIKQTRLHDDDPAQ